LYGVYDMMYERMKGTHAALVDIKTPTNSMTLTLETLSILSRNANYREQQQLPSDPSSKAIARWAGLDWSYEGDSGDDEYSDDGKLSYNSDYESTWH
jgi:hypothetical protein